MTPPNQQNEGQQLMDQALAIRNQNPGAALGILRPLKGSTTFPLAHVAAEEYGKTLLQASRPEEALQEFKKLMRKFSRPSQAYGKARALTWAAKASIELGQVQDIKGQLEEAEAIFSENGAMVELGIVSQLKASISAEAGDYGKASQQVARGSRLTAYDAPFSPDTRATSPDRILVGSGQQN